MWIFLSVLCAWFLATADVFAKQELADGDTLVLSWARMVFALPILAFLIPLGKPPSDPGTFLFWLAAALPLEILALLLYMAALKRSPMSLTVPFLAFTPVFILATGWMILGEKPGASGVTGVLLLAAGGYVISIRAGSRGLAAPFRNFAREPGSVMMAGVTVIYSMTAVVGKKLILLSSPAFVALVYFACVAVILTAILAARGGLGRVRPLFSRPGVWGMGATQAGMIITHTLAVVLVPAAYMIAVKRTSLLFGVLYGLFLFGEADARYRLPGAALMMAGVFVLAFF
ncbi:MAG: DMT family transporter [Pseudomonadota bacterium]